MFKFLGKNKFQKDLVIFQNDVSLESSEVYSRELLACASSAKLGGFSVEYIKYSSFDRNNSNDKIFILKTYNPKLFLFETDGFNLQSILKASSFIRKEIPNSKIALICNEDIANKLSSSDIFNFFILFDSDLVIVELLKNIDTITEKILNPHCDSEDKTTFLNFDMIPLFPRIPYFSSRHADEIGNFAFKNSKKEILYSPERVIFELKQLIKSPNVKHIDISDFAFMKDEKRFEKICFLLGELKKEVEMPLISCIADVKILAKHPEYFALMKNAGIQVINIVIGSSNLDSRKFYGLDFDNDELKSIVKNASHCGEILLNGIVFVGSPYDDKNTINDLSNFVISLSNMYPLCFDISIINLYPKIGSKMYNFVKTRESELKDGFLYTDDPDFDFLSDFSNPIYCTSKMSLEEIQNEIAFFNEKITMNIKNQLISPDLNHLIFNRKLFNDYYYISHNFSIVRSMFSYIIEYIDLIKKPYFFRLSDVKKEDILDIFPITVMLSNNYDPYKNTGYILENAPEPITVIDEIEVAGFEYALGKLKLKDIAKRIIADFPDKKLDEHDLIENKLLPFYKRMEDKFIMLFFR